jgi:hypothetical protein
MSTSTSTINYTPPASLPARRPRVNLRLVVLLGILALPFLYFGYVIIDQAVTGGVSKSGDVYNVDLKSLGSFPFDPNQDEDGSIPQRWRDLNGKKVALVGEMYAGASAAPKVPAFQLVYSIQKCCFGGPPRVQERVFVKAPPGNPVPFYWQPVRVVGTLHVGARKVDGQVVSVFEMDVERVEPVS